MVEKIDASPDHRLRPDTQVEIVDQPAQEQYEDDEGRFVKAGINTGMEQQHERRCRQSHHQPLVDPVAGLVQQVPNFCGP